MRALRWSSAVLVAAALLVKTTASHAEEPDQGDEPPPPTGLGPLITGGVLLGLGGVDALLAYPGCAFLRADAELNSPFSQVPRSYMSTCLEAWLGISGAFVVASIPLLIVGGQQRHVYKEWREDHPSPRSRIIRHVSLWPTPGGAVLGWRGEL